MPEITEIEVDPTELLPGDVVVALNDHDLSGCHCDVRVTVRRRIDKCIHPGVFNFNDAPTQFCTSCQTDVPLSEL